VIKSLHIKNFENHKDTTLDFSDGFNLICGLSNSGKSSILRALRLVAFNQWTPRSLRVGEDNAYVKIVTDRGSVEVERGKKKNIWTVKKNGGEPKFFDKPGSKVIPEVSDVIGLNAIKLGNHTIRPNIMDQLEGHFMLAEVEGDSASGSTRAQIIDEISGLAGMEELIRIVSLDNSRNGKKVKKAEEDIKNLSEQKNDELKMQREEEIINSVEGLIVKSDEKTKKKEDIESVCCNHSEVLKKLSVDKNLLDKMIDVDGVLGGLNDAENSITKAFDVSSLFKQHEQLEKDTSDLRRKTKSIPDPEPILDKLKLAEEKSKICEDVCEFFEQYSVEKESISKSKESLEKTKETLNETDDELETLVKSIDLCPICLKPVHAGCDAFVRVPVTDEEVAKEKRNIK
jgi:exonuclease SbcC